MSYDRFAGMTDKAIRNKEKPNEAEEALRDLQIKQRAKDFMDQYYNEPVFRRLLAQEIASQVVASSARDGA